MASDYAKTLQEIVDKTMRLCGDYRGAYTDGLRFTVSEVKAAVNDTVLEMIRFTGCLKDMSVIPLIDGQQVYDLPANMIRPIRFSINGINGTVILPKQISQFDQESRAVSGEGNPINFFRDKNLGPSQVGFHPTPGATGSTFTRDNDYGLLRRVVDGDGESIDYDANRALRRISGVPFSRSGSGQIIRSIISDYGNIHLTFIRVPQKIEKNTDFPDADIPVYMHKDIPYGAAARLLTSSTKKIHSKKLPRFAGKWARATNNLKVRCEHKASTAGLYPI